MRKAANQTTEEAYLIYIFLFFFEEVFSHAFMIVARALLVFLT